MKVTIVTVVYNSASTIADAMESVLRQTYKDIEYIIVDGQSYDGSVDIIRQYESRFQGRLRWISEPDKGIYDAMNKGVHMATGDVVGILNSDDFFTADNVIEKMVDHFTADVDAVYGDVCFVKAKNPKKRVRYYSGRIFRPWQLHFGFLPPHPSLYVRRFLFDECGYYDTSYRISADFEFIIRLCQHHKSLKYLHMNFVTMRIGGASTRDWESRFVGAKENLRACKQNHLFSNRGLICLKYPLKVIAFLPW